MTSTMPIEIIQDDNDKTNYLVLITAKLNGRFTTQEAVESRWRLHCLVVAKELGGKLLCESGEVVFDFSINSRKGGL